MKEKAEYVVVNVFLPISEAERRQKINRAIRELCVLDMEKSVCDFENGKSDAKC